MENIPATTSRGSNLEDLVSKLSDLLLSSGFRSPYGPFDGTDHTLQSLHDAILEALLNGGLLPEDTLERLLGDPADGDAKEGRNELEELIQRIIDQLYEQGFVAPQPDLSAEQARRAAGRGQEPGQDDLTQIRFEVTDKSLDFLGYRALRDLLGSLGKQQHRPARHARPGDRRRSDRRTETVRVRRHAESRSERDDPQRRLAADRQTPGVPDRRRL